MARKSVRWYAFSLLCVLCIALCTPKPNRLDSMHLTHGKAKRDSSLQDLLKPSTSSADGSGDNGKKSNEGMLKAQELADKGPAPMESANTNDSPTKLQTLASDISTKGTKSQFGTLPAEKPTSNPKAQCDTVRTRRPWSRATKKDRQTFLQAQHCLMSTPGIWTSNNHNSNSLWEDFALLHNALNEIIHSAAIFPPAHRVFVNTMEWAMRSKCNFDGDYLYMDIWTYADQNEFWTTSDIWSEEYYGTFKGTGTPGMFTDQTVHFNADLGDSSIIYKVDRPLKKHLRTVSVEGVPFINYFTTDYVNAMNEKDDFWEWEQLLESTYHQYQHVGHGGDCRTSTSPNCPWFWAIHSGVDAVWSLYQEIDGGKNRFKFNGKRRTHTNANISDSIPMLNTWSVDFNVGDMLDTRAKPNCYEYEFTDGLGV